MAMRTREQQKAIFAKKFGKYFGNLKDSVGIKAPKDSRFAFGPTVPQILDDMHRTDVYGRPIGQIGIGPDMGMVGSTDYSYPEYSKRPSHESKKDQ